MGKRDLHRAIDNSKLSMDEIADRLKDRKGRMSFMTYDRLLSSDKVKQDKGRITNQEIENIGGILSGLFAKKDGKNKIGL